LIKIEYTLFLVGCNQMDCPICFETITKETGQVTTSCGHTFHFKCLNTWYWRQTQTEEGQETCPCCRKEPGEFERASTVTHSETESESIAEWTVDENENNEWIRVGPARWIVPSSEPERLRILAQVASEEEKRNEFHIPPYSAENHALWNLRHMFHEEAEVFHEEPLSRFDRPLLSRKRHRWYGRTFWSNLGREHNLQEIDGYKTD
jgi:hypothetical protein